MNRIVCRDVHSETVNGQQYLIIVAAEDDGEIPSAAISDLLNEPGKLARVKEQLAAKGIVLGASFAKSRPGQNPPGSHEPPTQVAARDDEGQHHCLLAERVERYSLSSGSIIYFCHVPDAPDDGRWMVGRQLELSESPQAGAALANGQRQG